MQLPSRCIILIQILLRLENKSMMRDVYLFVFSLPLPRKSLCIERMHDMLSYIPWFVI